MLAAAFGRLKAARLRMQSCRNNLHVHIIITIIIIIIMIIIIISSSIAHIYSRWHGCSARRGPTKTGPGLTATRP